MADVTQVVVENTDISVVVGASNDVSLVVSEVDVPAIVVETNDQSVVIETVETQVVATTEELTTVVETTELQVLTVGEAGPSGPQGPPGTSGGLGAISTKTTTYLVVPTDGTILADATGAPFTISLPVAPATGQIFNFKKIDATANIVTVSGNGKLIDGAATALIKTQYTSLEIQYSDAAWEVI